MFKYDLSFYILICTVYYKCMYTKITTQFFPNGHYTLNFFLLSVSRTLSLFLLVLYNSIITFHYNLLSRGFHIINIVFPIYKWKASQGIVKDGTKYQHRQIASVLGCCSNCSVNCLESRDKGGVKPVFYCSFIG